MSDVSPSRVFSEGNPCTSAEAYGSLHKGRLVPVGRLQPGANARPSQPQAARSPLSTGDTTRLQLRRAESAFRRCLVKKLACLPLPLTACQP